MLAAERFSYILLCVDSYDPFKSVFPQYRVRVKMKVDSYVVSINVCFCMRNIRKYKQKVRFMLIKQAFFFKFHILDFFNKKKCYLTFYPSTS
jgi:hypothetical protein